MVDKNSTISGIPIGIFYGRKMALVKKEKEKGERKEMMVPKAAV